VARRTAHGLVVRLQRGTGEKRIVDRTAYALGDGSQTTHSRFARSNLESATNPRRARSGSLGRGATSVDGPSSVGRLPGGDYAHLGALRAEVVFFPMYGRRAPDPQPECRRGGLGRRRSGLGRSRDEAIASYGSKYPLERAQPTVHARPSRIRDAATRADGDVEHSRCEPGNEATYTRMGVGKGSGTGSCEPCLHGVVAWERIRAPRSRRSLAHAESAERIPDAQRRDSGHGHGHFGPVEDPTGAVQRPS